METKEEAIQRIALQLRLDRFSYYGSAGGRELSVKDAIHYIETGSSYSVKMADMNSRQYVKEPYRR